MTETASNSDVRLWRRIALGALAVVVGLLAWIIANPSSQSEKQISNQSAVPALPVAYVPVRFSEIAGWEQGVQQQAIGAFELSCRQLPSRSADEAFNSKEATGLIVDFPVAGFVADWLPACQDIKTAYGSAENARRFFEKHFRPFQVLQPDEESPDNHLTPQGLFTGYFEPVYKASDVRTEEMSAPILSRPDDLIMVDLGAFRDELAGTRLAGRVADGQLVPYASHEEIVTDGMNANILGWMNPNDLLFLQIQGSGKLDYGGEIKRFGYAAQNGHPYTAIGAPLIRSGAISREEMSMQAIYDWLESASPEEAQTLRFTNESYVFFRPLTDLPDPDLGPVGASGLQLSDGRSLAVDRRYHAMGAPVWIDFEGMSDESSREQRLVIAQDTGGAISGPVRGDLFIGSSTAAGEVAGTMKQRGQMFVFLPLEAAARLEKFHEASHSE